mmetsp:Transcript_88051/g.174733  ORF Transcript_88051/g.174733 Transcript_88051/m.174733 type:complete len:274 (+) Transcript_88051:797-1618(+)
MESLIHYTNLVCSTPRCSAVTSGIITPLFDNAFQSKGKLFLKICTNVRGFAEWQLQSVTTKFYAERCLITGQRLRFACLIQSVRAMGREVVLVSVPMDVRVLRVLAMFLRSLVFEAAMALGMKILGCHYHATFLHKGLSELNNAAREFAETFIYRAPARLPKRASGEVLLEIDDDQHVLVGDASCIKVQNCFVRLDEVIILCSFFAASFNILSRVVSTCFFESWIVLCSKNLTDPHPDIGRSFERLERKLAVLLLGDVEDIFHHTLAATFFWG